MLSFSLKYTHATISFKSMRTLIIKYFKSDKSRNVCYFAVRHAVVIMQTLNLTNQCPLFMTVRHIFEISEDDHQPKLRW
jgi:hypothetical protein